MRDACDESVFNYHLFDTDSGDLLLIAVHSNYPLQWSVR